ncbi:tetratricopeptide repeat protein [Pseudobacteriovorax antillogorgiicola]|uniref:Uncharacterized protein n=1 Tax=Pseudobacteriovorax antillogorgiicola TaxID=1513793 RepID=A0A1Y6B3P3_9BACT|nr:tetratricopeptide repeat protein [Pseudobacteriovorax antillogorgiicola]TCS59265.1 hypothetical protein EDD56_101170 [Pseudobacteriovorax antillogorgiicola]SME89925.1 hypothetical protein SAMN06296036_101316 [Pseudobacteriovorax antillogorgiicola]
MSTSSYLSHYPNLEQWYFHKGLQDENRTLFRLCRSLNAEGFNEVCDNISFFFLNLTNLSENDLIETLEDLETYCSAMKTNYHNLVVQIVERSIKEDCWQSLYSSLSALARKSKMSIYCFMSAWMALNTDKREDCLEFYELSDQKNADFHSLLGQAYIELEQFDKAHRCFELSTEMAPLDPIHWFWHAKSAFTLGLTDEAWQSAKECQNLLPHNAEACVLLGMITTEIDGPRQSQLEVAWNALWPLIDHVEDPGFLAQLMFGIGFKMSDESYTHALIEKINFKRLARNTEFIGKLGSILRELASKPWPETNRLFLEKYQEALRA